MSVTCQLQRLIFPPWPRPNRRIPVKSGRGLARKTVTFLVGTGRDFKISYKAFRDGVRMNNELLATNNNGERGPART